MVIIHTLFGLVVAILVGYLLVKLVLWISKDGAFQNMTDEQLKEITNGLGCIALILIVIAIGVVCK